jgi:hypothetical protein
VPAPASKRGAGDFGTGHRDADEAERIAMLRGDTKAQAHLWADEFIVTNTAGEVLSKRQVLDVFEAGIVPYSVFRADDGGRADLRAGRRLDRS